MRSCRCDHEQREKDNAKQLIRVFYPTDRARIALRTEADWDTNIEPDSVQRNGCVSEFQIETEQSSRFEDAVRLRITASRHWL